MKGKLVCPIRAGKGCVRVVGTVWNNLKRGATEKKGGKQRFKKGGKLGQGVGALKRGLEPPSELCNILFGSAWCLITTQIQFS